MKSKTSEMIGFIVLILFFFASLGVAAQNKPKIERQGNTFVQAPSTRGKVTKTQYVFIDSKGRKDTIYLSGTGRAFVYRVSKNGNVYPKYLPEVTRQLQLNQNGKSKDKVEE